jgi:transcriptional regulator with PAS, ATPase and Fis domain
MANEHQPSYKNGNTPLPIKGGIVTVNRVMEASMRRIKKVAPYADVIRLSGESGVGKELFARWTGTCSRREGEYIAFNAAGVDDHFFSDTLFGHVKGAYTNATKDRSGLVRLAHGGTLFIDEIGDLYLESQTKLLRLIQEKEFLPLGADQHRKADVLIVVASHRNLIQMVKEGTFRQDLFFRLDTHHIEIPPLRERLDDLPVLAHYFAQDIADHYKQPVPRIGRDLLTLFGEYPFPGNVRELRSMIENFIAIGYDGTDLSAIRSKMEQNLTLMDDTGSSFEGLIRRSTSLPSLDEMDRIYFEEVLRRTGGNQVRAAEIMGISQAAVCKRVKKRGLRPSG